VHCASSEEHLEGYLDGTLAGAQRAAVRAHLAGCGRCSGFLAELRALDGLLTARREPILPDDFSAAMMSEVGDLPAPRRARRPFGAYVVAYLLGSWLVIAAAFVLGGPAIRALGGVVAGPAGAVLLRLRALSLAGGSMAGELAHVVGAALLLEIPVLAALLVLFLRLRPPADKRSA
jgi:anti-sigma factor RsiW